MSTSKRFNPKNKQTLKIIVDERDYHLEFKLDPREYFYPYLLVGPDYVYDYAHYEEDGMSKEEYDNHIKINKMLQDKKYEDLFKEKFIKNLDDFLRKLEFEVKIHYEDGESLEQKVSKNEGIIFELLKKEGPYILRLNAILDKIQEWFDEKDFQNIENSITALKEHRKSVFGYIPYSYFENRYIVALYYPYILRKIREIKKDITKKKSKYRDNQKISKEIIDKWRKKQKEGVGRSICWFDILLEIAKKEEEKTGIDFISFVKQRGVSPKDLVKLIFSELIHKSPDTIDKIIRDRDKILKMMSRHWKT